MPLRDWNCKAHGVFESSEPAPRCPKGCNAVEAIFLRAPAVRTSQRTSNIDRTLDELATQFGLSDLSTRNGSVMNSIPLHSKPDHIQASYNSLYGDPRTEMLRPRFDSPQNVAGMLDGKPATAALAMRDKNHVGLGDVLHSRMGSGNVDPAMTMIAGKTTADDNAKLQAITQEAA
jgi:hypothetical protein